MGLLVGVTQLQLVAGINCSNEKKSAVVIAMQVTALLTGEFS